MLFLRIVALIALFWRLGHTLKALMRKTVPHRELAFFALDGVVLGLAGGILTRASFLQTLTWTVIGGIVFYSLAYLGMDLEDG